MALAKQQRATVATILLAAFLAVLISSGVILPILLQNASGDTATTSGLLMLPGAAIGAMCGLVAGRAFDRHGVRGISLLGIAVLAGGTAGYLAITMDSPLLFIGTAYGVACVGLQMLVTPVNTWGINSLPSGAVPHGNAIVTTLQQVGSSFGTAFAVSLTALWGVAMPNASTAAEQAFGGCHMAFVGIFGLVVLIAVLIVGFVRER